MEKRYAKWAQGDNLVNDLRSLALSGDTTALALVDRWEL